MEINITPLLSIDTWPIVGSIFTHGPNSTKATWEAAQKQAETTSFLITQEELETMRNCMQQIGYWGKGEIGNIPEKDLNTLFIQSAVWELRNIQLEGRDVESFDWEEYEQKVKAGIYSGVIYRGDDGQVYFNLGE